MKKSVTTGIGGVVAGIACVAVIAATVLAGLYFGGVIQYPKNDTPITNSSGGEQSGEQSPDAPNDIEQETETKLLQMANNTTAVRNVGTWYYWIDGDEGTDYEFAENGLPTITGRTMSATLNKLSTSSGKYFYFRYQPLSPTDPDEDGNFLMYNIHFNLNVSADCSVRYGTVTTFGGFKTEEIAAGETVSLTYAAQANSVQPFSIAVTSCKTPITVEVTITEITFPVVFG